MKKIYVAEMYEDRGPELSDKNVIVATIVAESEAEAYAILEAQGFKEANEDEDEENEDFRYVEMSLTLVDQLHISDYNLDNGW